MGGSEWATRGAESAPKRDKLALTVLTLSSAPECLPPSRLYVLARGKLPCTFLLVISFSFLFGRLEMDEKCRYYCYFWVSSYFSLLSFFLYWFFCSKGKVTQNVPSFYVISFSSQFGLAETDEKCRQGVIISL